MPTVLEQLSGAALGLLLVHFLVQLKSFRKLSSDGQHRIQRCHRLLEHHGDAVAPDVPHLGVVHLQEVFALEDHLSGDGPTRRRWDEAHDGKGVNALFRNPLSPTTTEDFTLFQIVVDPIDGLDNSILGKEMGCEVTYL